jgi:nucleotide-binding universal stress UspA family protein
MLAACAMVLYFRVHPGRVVSEPAILFTGGVPMLHTAAVKVGLNEPRGKFLDMLRLLQSFGTTRLHLIHVHSGSNTEFERKKEQLEMLAGEVRELGFTVETAAERGAPARKTVALAHELEVDYLALYWLPKPLLVQAIMGSIDADILRLSDIPVFVYNRSLMQASTHIGRVLYATDFKATDANVLPYLKARDFQAEELYVLHVGERAPDPAAEHARQDCVEQNLDRLARECEEAYDTVHPLQVVGSKLSQILRQARRVGADLIVIGKRDNPSPLGNILGSTADALPGKSRRSVFIVPGRH